jgi:hypothetical protein
VSAAPHTGVVPVHKAALVDEHCPHTFVDRSHAGVPPLQSPSPAHCSHKPAFGPVVTQTLLRHMPLFAHVPTPLR